MQVRLRNLIENRTRLLAAISHDLRTPLTLLRLRTESVEHLQERDKMLSTITEMDTDDRGDAEIRARRRCGRATGSCRPRGITQGITDDMSDAGLPVTMTPAGSIVYQCRPYALKRALANLIDNAVECGRKAHAAIAVTPKAIEIVIDDEGQGSPGSELSRVFEPFYRVEDGGAGETGEIDAGRIAMAGSIVQSHGGDQCLAIGQPTVCEPQSSYRGDGPSAGMPNLSKYFGAIE